MSCPAIPEPVFFHGLYFFQDGYFSFAPVLSLQDWHFYGSFSSDGYFIVRSMTTVSALSRTGNFSA